MEAARAAAATLPSCAIKSEEKLNEVMSTTDLLVHAYEQHMTNPNQNTDQEEEEDRRSRSRNDQNQNDGNNKANDNSNKHRHQHTTTVALNLMALCVNSVRIRGKEQNFSRTLQQLTE